MISNATTFTDLKTFWAQCELGQPPSDGQFIVWLELHKYEVVRQGIARTAMKNLQLRGQMSLDYKIRFASKVMRTRTCDLQKAAGQRSVDQPRLDAGEITLD